MLSICRGRSGEALTRNQLSPLLEIAVLDCVCCAILPARAALQFVQLQFHCGRPPPAALPRIRMRIDLSSLDQTAPE
jgi:hypothetical protein